MRMLKLYLSIKHLTFGIAILSLCLFSCNHANEHEGSTIKITKTKTSISPGNLSDKQEIQNLIRNVLNWGESKKNSFDLLPALADSKDSVYIGFDLEKLRVNLEKLKATN